MHKRWVYESNSKLHHVGMKIGIMLRIYRTYNLIVEFSNHEFNNKLLGGVTLLEPNPYIDGFKLHSKVFRTGPFIEP